MENNYEFEKKYNELKDGYITMWYVFSVIFCLFDIVCLVSFNVCGIELIGSLIVTIIAIFYCLWIIKQIKKNY